MINTKINKWFDTGNIVQALLGQYEYFIPDITNKNEHDRILITRQLLHWADTEVKKEKAVQGIEEAITCTSKENKIWTLLDIILSYLIVSDTDKKFLSVNMQQVIMVVGESLRKNAQEISTNENLRYFVLNMIEKLPELKSYLNIGGE